MTPQMAFGLSILMSFVTWTIVAARYWWPWLREQPLAEALRPLLLLHSIRFVGLAFIVPGVVSADLPASFAQPAAMGDLLAAGLALLSLATLGTGFGRIAAIVFNVAGTADLLNAYYQGMASGVGAHPGLMGTMYFAPALVVPLLLVTHALIFMLLFRRGAAGMAGERNR